MKQLNLVFALIILFSCIPVIIRTYRELNQPDCVNRINPNFNCPNNNTMDFHNVTIESIIGAIALGIILFLIVFIRWVIISVIQDHINEGDDK